MNEEINKRNGELSDAALEGVSGGGTFENTVQSACRSCPGRKGEVSISYIYRCEFEGSEEERTAKLVYYISVKGIPHFSFTGCPYFKFTPREGI